MDIGKAVKKVNEEQDSYLSVYDLDGNKLIYSSLDSDISKELIKKYNKEPLENQERIIHIPVGSEFFGIKKDGNLLFYLPHREIFMKIKSLEEVELGKIVIKDIKSEEERLEKIDDIIKVLEENNYFKHSFRTDLDNMFSENLTKLVDMVKELA